MIFFFQLYSAIGLLEKDLQVQNSRVFDSLRRLAEAKHFSKIKMSFNDQCPLKMKKCSKSTCTVPRIKFEGLDGVIDLLSIKESYSPTSAQSGSIVWQEIYKEAKENLDLERIISGLHFSVNTHLTRFHTQIFNKYFSHPLLFKKRYRREFRDNFLFLYKIIQSSVANLSNANGEIAEEAKDFGDKLRAVMLNSSYLNEHNNLIFTDKTNKKSLFEKQNKLDVENKEASAIIEQLSTEEFIGTLPKVDPKTIDKINMFVKYIACLNCDKCKLWGTLQVKGIKAAVKSLNGIYMFKSDVIFLINLFRQLSITMNEYKKLEKYRYSYVSLILICHKQILLIVVFGLMLFLILQKKRKLRKIKVE